MTESNVVGNVALVARLVHGVLELLLAFLILLFFEEHATLGNNGFSRVRLHLINEGPGVVDFLKFVLNSDLKLEDLVSKLSVLDLLDYFLGILVHAGLVERLCVVHFV